MPQPKVDIVVVNWNSGSQLRACLESVEKYGRGQNVVAAVYVVDNDSSDGSLGGIDWENGFFKLQKKIKNTGFAAGCNSGAVQGTSPFILFLNPDTILFENSLTIPLSFMESNESEGVGICGIQLINEDGKVARSCARFPRTGIIYSKIFGLGHLSTRCFPGHFMREWDHGDCREVDQVMGAFFFTRRTVFKSMHGFDERFFVYYEELDFSLRAKKAGWKTRFLSTAKVFHKGGGTSDQVKAVRLFYSLRSRLHYVFKHFGPLPATLVALGTIFIEPVTRIGFAILKRSLKEVEETYKGYLMLWKHLPTFLSRTEGT